jgi:ferrochelatase
VRTGATKGFAFDAVVVVSFGGPEGPDDVMPFLRNVVRGRNVPPERLEQVAAQYHLFGGISPINDHNRHLVAALRSALEGRGRELPVYWGNRNWHPYLPDTVARMRDDGITFAAAFVTSAYSSYSGSRQYIEDIEAAVAGAGEGAPEIVKLQPYFDRSGFVGPFVDGLRAARVEAGPDAPVIMTAHSLPCSVAATCDYERQLRQVARTLAIEAGEPEDGWTLAFQSRSGPPSQPWLEPDLNDVISSLPDGPGAVIVVPIGFVADHMEVVHDVDLVAGAVGRSKGLRLVRVPTPGRDARFAEMAADLVLEAEQRRRDGLPLGPWCGPGCCPPPTPASARASVTAP